MSLLIFIPNVQGCDAPKHFAGVGLAELLREGDPRPNSNEPLVPGPGGKRGVIYSWGIAAYKPDEQDWFEAKRAPLLPAGRFWCGWPKGQRPGPDELLRDRGTTLDGYRARLGDGKEWCVPNSMILPFRFALGDDGQIEKPIARPYEAIREQALWALGEVERYVRQEADIDWEKAVKYCAFMLSINYRVNLEICLALELFDDKNVGRIMSLSSDYERIVAILSEKKSPAAPAGASGGDG